MKLILLTFILLTSALTSVANTEVPSPWGMNYFSFWEGHSLGDGKTAKNWQKGRLDDGLQLFNLISNTYRLNDRYSVDLQTRLEHIPITFRGDTKNGQPTEPSWRFQGLRLGISGKLASGEKWSLKGALNTDIPELNGRDARLRKVIFNPGLFAGFNYLLDDRWSLYAIVSPRIFFYTDDEAIEPEWLVGKNRPGQKPRFLINLDPSINYAVDDKLGWRLGAALSLRQFVESESTYIRRWPTSVSAGPTYVFNKHFNIWTYVQAWPFDGKKTHIETVSWGAWINGIIF
jgi:hypothetical protein